MNLSTGFYMNSNEELLTVYIAKLYEADKLTGANNIVLEFDGTVLHEIGSILTFEFKHKEHNFIDIFKYKLIRIIYDEVKDKTTVNLELIERIAGTDEIKNKEG